MIQSINYATALNSPQYLKTNKTQLELNKIELDKLSQHQNAKASVLIQFGKANKKKNPFTISITPSYPNMGLEPKDTPSGQGQGRGGLPRVAQTIAWMLKSPTAMPMTFDLAHIKLGDAEQDFDQRVKHYRKRLSELEWKPTNFKIKQVVPIKGKPGQQQEIIFEVFHKKDYLSDQEVIGVTSFSPIKENDGLPVVKDGKVIREGDDLRNTCLFETKKTFTPNLLVAPNNTNKHAMAQHRNTEVAFWMYNVAHAALEYYKDRTEGIDGFLLHDWPTGSIPKALKDLEDTYKDLTKKTFITTMVHNARYDNPALPESNLLPYKNEQGMLHAAVRAADTVLLNNQYLKHDIMLGDALAINNKIKHLLLDKYRNKVSYHLNHAVGEDYTKNSEFKSVGKLVEALEKASAKSATTIDKKSFVNMKQGFKLAAQKEFGLEKNEDAFLIFSDSRLNIHQKKANIMLPVLAEVLKENENVQIIITQDASEGSLLEPMLKKLEEVFPDRFKRVPYFYEKDEKGKAKPLPPGRDPNYIMAMLGADFGLMPTAFEPIGTSDLNAHNLGLVPITDPIGGNREKNFDPDEELNTQLRKTATWVDPENGNEVIVPGVEKDPYGEDLSRFGPNAFFIRPVYHLDRNKAEQDDWEDLHAKDVLFNEPSTRKQWVNYYRDESRPAPALVNDLLNFMEGRLGPDDYEEFLNSNARTWGQQLNNGGANYTHGAEARFIYAQLLENTKEAIERAADISKDDWLDMAINGFNLVQENHSKEKLSQLYKKSVEDINRNNTPLWRSIPNYQGSYNYQPYAQAELLNTEA